MRFNFLVVKPFRSSSFGKLLKSNSTIRIGNLKPQYCDDVVEDRAGWGRLRAGKFDNFTSAVQLDLYILSYYTTMSAQRENGLHNSWCAAA